MRHFFHTGFPINKLQSRVLHLHCYDYDRFSRDDSIGEFHLPLCQVIRRGRWKKILPSLDALFSMQHKFPARQRRDQSVCLTDATAAVASSLIATDKAQNDIFFICLCCWRHSRSTTVLPDNSLLCDRRIR